MMLSYAIFFLLIRVYKKLKSQITIIYKSSVYFIVNMTVFASIITTASTTLIIIISTTTIAIIIIIITTLQCLKN